MSTKYEKNVYLAMLAEQCNRFNEMVSFLEDMLKQRDKDLNSDERNLLSIAYKNSISGLRSALRTIMAYENKEKKKENSTFLPYIQEYRKKVEDELTKTCKNVLKVIDEDLLKKAEDDEAKVFYVKMKGDYNRYIAEYAEGDLKKQVSDDALKSYNDASETAKSLPVLNPIALGLALNFSVFYYEVMNDHSKAIDIASQALDKANKELPNIDEDADDNRDTVSIVNLLKENLDMWKSEEEDGEN
jgi:14-3-3 protein epsilon